MNDQKKLADGGNPPSVWLEVWIVLRDHAVCLGRAYVGTFDVMAAGFGVLGSAPSPFALSEFECTRKAGVIKRKAIRTGVFAPESAMEATEGRTGPMVNRIAALTCDLPARGHGFYSGEQPPDERNIRAIVAEVLES